MTRTEVSLAADWAAAEGWNPGFHDADCFYAADPGGFLIGLLGDVPVATLSAVRYGTSFGFLGFYIVQPSYRGRGFGKRLWDVGIARLEGRTVGLDGVVAQQDNYRTSGFELAYNNRRYEGVGGGHPPAEPTLVDLSVVPFETIRAYDQLFFPDDRDRFLACWTRPPEGRALGVFRDGELEGYGVIRACRSGHKIGPLFADTSGDAERLFRALRAYAPEGTPIFLDTPAANPEAVSLAERHGMAVVFETARMYKGPTPELSIARTYGVTTFELG